MSTTTTTIRATLDLVFRKGTHGLFPVGTLKSNIGTFACRDKWLEGLTEGTYDGEFDILEIQLCSYLTKKYNPEIRCYNKAIVYCYRFDNMSDKIASTEFEFLDDPILEEIPETEDELPDWVIEKPKTPPTDVQFIQDKLHSVGHAAVWSIGDNIIVPAEIDRIDQRTIVSTLIKNGYSLVDPNKRLWSIVAQELENV